MSESERGIDSGREHKHRGHRGGMDDEMEFDDSSGGGESGGRGGRGGRAARGRGRERKLRRRFGRGKPCYFCVNKLHYVDYKTPALLERFTTERAKIQPRRLTGVCAKHQRMLKVAMNRARFLALIPYKR